MFSKPLFDKRTGTFSIKGGENLLDPNPVPAEQSPNAKVYYETPYSQRQRRTVVDPGRNSDDYQRPIIDRLHNDSVYTGLWEVVHVKTQGGYVPDSIKSRSTLLEAADAGKVTTHPHRQGHQLSGHRRGHLGGALADDLPAGERRPSGLHGPPAPGRDLVPHQAGLLLPGQRLRDHR